MKNFLNLFISAPPPPGGLSAFNIKITTMRVPAIVCYSIYLFLPILFSCKDNTATQTAEINSLDLKRGEIVSCGPQDGELFGSVSFTASVPDSLKKDFNIAIALLHSFEYNESEKMFAKIIERSPDCAMAYWGVAMSNFHPLWAPPTEAELRKGAKAIELAASINNKTKRESDYIDALAKFFENAGQSDHRTRVLSYENAMEKLYQTYPDDIEAGVFYALALNAAADPADKTYAKQKKAFSILNPIFQKQPLHPGLAHYIIHNCDYPPLAELALPAARKYASIAPASAHAQHMPSHIFTRLGLWDECIRSNLVSVSAAQCYAIKAKIKGHWDEELHGIDYVVYAYLQKGNDELAKQQLDYLQTIDEVDGVNFKTAYAFAAIPARYALERKMWKEAAALPLHPDGFPWEKFPWEESIIHFARSLGALHLNDINTAKTELENLKSRYDKLAKQSDKKQEAIQVAIQVKATEAWIEYKQRNNEKALELMKEAAEMEDGTEKHPVTPGEVIPARELYGEMLLEMNKPALALENFELDLKTHPNRFNGLYNAAIAAQKAGNKEKAILYFKKLVEISDPKNCKRAELNNAKLFLSRL
jgi:tetratricopeptide (TPR) repeat protein